MSIVYELAITFYYNERTLVERYVIYLEPHAVLEVIDRISNFKGVEHNICFRKLIDFEHPNKIKTVQGALNYLLIP